MSGSSSINGTTIVSGPDVIQTSDFYVHAGILHPLIVGSIAVIILFFFLRLASNRSVAPITVFDWIINVALGSTLAGIVNGNSLVRGLIALWTMLAFQYITSHTSSHYKNRFEWIFAAPPLVVAFRGDFLRKTMSKHRISESDIYSALRQHGVLNIKQVEAIIIEANGTFSIFEMDALKDCKFEPSALLNVPAYKALCEQLENDKLEKKASSQTAVEDIEAAVKAQPVEPYDRVAMNNERPDGVGWIVQSVLPV